LEIRHALPGLMRTFNPVLDSGGKFDKCFDHSPAITNPRPCRTIPGTIALPSNTGQANHHSYTFSRPINCHYDCISPTKLHPGVAITAELYQNVQESTSEDSLSDTNEIPRFQPQEWCDRIARFVQTLVAFMSLHIACHPCG
jgi:hypothetical protein